MVNETVAGMVLVMAGVVVMVVHCAIPVVPVLAVTAVVVPVVPAVGTDPV